VPDSAPPSREERGIFLRCQVPSNDRSHTSALLVSGSQPGRRSGMPPQKFRQRLIPRHRAWRVVIGLPPFVVWSVGQRQTVKLQGTRAPGLTIAQKLPFRRVILRREKAIVAPSTTAWPWPSSGFFRRFRQHGLANPSASHRRRSPFANRAWHARGQSASRRSSDPVPCVEVSHDAGNRSGINDLHNAPLTVQVLSRELDHIEPSSDAGSPRLCGSSSWPAVTNFALKRLHRLPGCHTRPA